MAEQRSSRGTRRPLAAPVLLEQADLHQCGVVCHDGMAHRDLLEQYLASRRDGDAADEPEQPIDPATRLRLEALGYLE